ncbi:MAG: hypothetical protein CR978_00115 [Gammaproteobacteria bacterium]|nr:MAG: hypothetical protein CR978_00115 [Gammaproteobacteria bacterium]
MQCRDGGGFSLWRKRFERDKFKWPRKASMKGKGEPEATEAKLLATLEADSRMKTVLARIFHQER